MAIQKRTTAKGKIRWVARYRDRTGKERSASFDTRKEAKAYVEEQETALRQGTWIDPANKVTVGYLARKWAEQPGRDSTIHNRKFLASNLGTLGDMPIGTVVSSDITAWRDTLLYGRPWKNNKPLSETSIANLASALSTLFKRAMEDNIIPRVPKFDFSKSTKVKPTRADLITDAELKALIKHAGKDYPRSPERPWLVTMIIIAIGTGMRVSEICGLQVDNIDRLNGKIHVLEQSDRNGDKLVPLKSDSSKREIPTPDFVFDAIDSYLAKFPRKAGQSIFFRVVNGKEKMFSKHSVGQALIRVQEMHGLRMKTFHDFRHYYASGLIASGVAVAGVQKALGHASSQTTLAVYTHFWPGQEDTTRKAAESRGEFLRDFSGIGDGDPASNNGGDDGSAGGFMQVVS